MSRLRLLVAGARIGGHYGFRRVAWAVRALSLAARPLRLESWALVVPVQVAREGQLRQWSVGVHFNDAVSRINRFNSSHPLGLKFFLIL